MKHFEKLTILIIASILCLILIACNSDIIETPLPKVDYSIENAFEVETTDNSGTLTFAPKGVACEYGLIFYVGTALAPTGYTYLGEALAKQGYLVVIPQIGKMNLAYMQYPETEAAFNDHADVKFFIGGHSQGGGAAIRRAQENETITQGVLLYAPLCYSQNLEDEEGNSVSVPDSIANMNIPALLIEATEDHVLTNAMKNDSRTRLPDGYTHHIINGGCHMSFSTFDSSATLSIFNDGPLVNITRDEQRALTVSHTLEFLKSVVTAK